jgi:hypothetical protein
MKIQNKIIIHLVAIMLIVCSLPLIILYLLIKLYNKIFYGR